MMTNDDTPPTNMPLNDATGDGATTPGLTSPVHARAVRSGFHFWKIIIMGLLVFGFAGCAFLYDGFVRYPAINARIATIESQLNGTRLDEATRAELSRERKTLTEHDALGITIQKIVGFICVPLGLYIIIRHLRTVRGEYVLADDVLSIPDGRRIPLAAITDVRNAKWEAKAIATFLYRLPDGETGSFKLDALAFDTKPTDAIHDEIVARVPKTA